jgi:acetyl-CoA C-acetyltransferase
MSADSPVFVIDGARTPFLKARNEPGPFSATDLAVQAGRALLLRQRFAPSDLDEVILGCAAPAADEANIGRIAALRLGCGHRVPGWTVMRNCASGLQAVDSALVNIRAGRADLVLAGGTDALSRAPLLFSEAMVRWLARLRSARGFARLAALRGFRPAYLAPVIGLLKGLTDPVVGLSMGQTAENLAWRFSIDRLAMDAYAAESHRRALAGRAAGAFAEIVPLIGADGTVYASDDGVREDSTLDRLGKLKPVFDRPYGNVTAGNSSQVTDGAAWLLLASQRAVDRYGLSPLARLVDSGWAGLDPAEMGLGPVHAATPLLLRNGLALADLDLIEINEAFAAQVLGCLAAWESDDYCRRVLGLERALGGIERTRLNVDGGAIAIGHPVGASGARIVLHLIGALRARGLRRGLAAICIGGGQGGALLVEVEGGAAAATTATAAPVAGGST